MEDVVMDPFSIKQVAELASKTKSSEIPSFKNENKALGVISQGEQAKSFSPLTRDIPTFKNQNIMVADRDFSQSNLDTISDGTSTRNDDIKLAKRNENDNSESINGNNLPETQGNIIGGSYKDVTDKTMQAPLTETYEVQEQKKEYVEDIVDRSDVPETIAKQEALEKEYHKLSPEANAEMRSDFNQSKLELRAEWEKINNQEWPRYKEDVYLPSKDTLYRRAGDAYDAHHIQPLGLGGKNDARNLTPIHALEHADKMGIHAPDSPYDKLNKTLGVV